MTLTCAAVTDRGLVRRNNEDAYIADAALGLFAVADGMGGHAGGEVASRVVADELRRGVLRTGESTDPTDRLEEAIRGANRRLAELVQGKVVQDGAGATVAAALVHDDRAVIANVGDCRVYLARADTLTQITRDHSMVAEQVSLGLLAPEEAARHPLRHVVTRSISGNEDIAVDTWELPVRAGDRMLLCSDGVHGLVEAADLSRLACDPTGDLGALCRKIVDLAKQRGGSDNATVVLVSIT
jgi:protein phosphatase